MNETQMNILALPTPNLGYHNQILGGFRALSDLSGLPYNPEAFLWPEGVENIGGFKNSFFQSKRENYEALKSRVFSLLERYLEKTGQIPHIFITVYDATDSKFSPENVDMVCRAVKEYYMNHNLGEIITAILTSRLHRYKYIDLINVPKHMLTFRSRIRLLQNREIKKKVLVTVGTINNFNRRNVLEKYKELLEKINNSSADEIVAEQCQKLKRYMALSKKAVFCLGGRVDGPEIVFDLNYAKKILADAMRLCRCGYGVAIVNGPRTPNDVVDFLYEKTIDMENILFQNCKKVIEDEADHGNWRIYSGKYEKQLKSLEKLGNIYPGIIGFDNTVVVHSMDSYAGCETAAAAFPTAISSRGLFIDPVVRYDCHNLKDLLCPKYAIDWDDFINIADHMGVEPKDLRPQVLSNPLRVFAEAVINRMNQKNKSKAKRKRG